MGEWLRRLFRRHEHEWADLFEFDSAFEITIPTGGSRVTGRAMMMKCRGCGEMRRRPLPLTAAEEGIDR